MATASDFSITIHNSTKDQVKATKFQYKDGSNWKVENLFGIDGHQIIESGHGVVFTRNLGGIGGENTEFSVTYMHHTGGTVYGPDLFAYTDTFTANDHGKKTVFLTK